MLKKLIGGCSVLAAVSLLLPVSSASASVLYYEGFNYTPGSVNTAGTDWNNTKFGGATTPTFDAGSLAYPLLVTSGNHLAQNDPPGTTGADTPNTVNDSSATFNDMFSAAGTYYMTIVGQVQNDVTGLDGMGVISLNPVPTPPFTVPGIQMGFQADGAGNLTPNMEVNGANQIFGSPIALSGAFLIAMRVINDGGAGAEDIRLIMNPDLSLGEPDWNSPTLSVTNKDIAHTSAASGQIFISRAHFWDEIRVATTWNEAAPIPEPASLALACLGGLMVLRRRRAR